MADIKLKNASGEEVVYSGVDVLQVANTEGGTEEFVDKALLGDIPTKTSQLENDSGFITADDLPAGGGGSSGPVSWNDITDKPFYESGPVLTEVLPSTDVPFTLDGGMYVFMNTATEEQATAWESEWETAIVTWNGVEYTCQPQIVDGIKAIGDVGLMMGTGSSGEPFVMMCASMEGGIFIAYDTVTTPADDAVDGDTITNNIRIQLNMVEIHPLDEKFVPELDYESKIKNKPFGTTLAGTLIGKGTVTCDSVNDTDSDGNPLSHYGLIDEIPLVRGGQYYATVSATINGEVMNAELTGTASGTNIIQLPLVVSGGSSTLAVFVNGAFGGKTAILAESTEPITVDYQLYANTDIIKKIDEKYLPETSGLPTVTTSDNNKVLTVVNGAWAAQTPATGLPTVSTSDNGKFLQVSNGAWAAVSLTDVSQEGA